MPGWGFPGNQAPTWHLVARQLRRAADRARQVAAVRSGTLVAAVLFFFDQFFFLTLRF
jgi:hypothetical protein